MSNRVAINPQLLIWARQRAQLDVDFLSQKFPKLQQWELGQEKPTLKQLENFAAKVKVPIGYLFLPAPIEEKLPIQDFRTLANSPMLSPSRDLLDSIYICQQRQDWYKNYAQLNALPKLDFIGSVTINDKVAKVAEKINSTFAMSAKQRYQKSTLQASLRYMIDKLEAAGILVMINSTVGTNNKRKLVVEEFRGFALADTLAPIIFINGADSKSAQIFTLAHELAHLWLGETGLSAIQLAENSIKENEKWCNDLAAQLLVPLADIEQNFNNNQPLPQQVKSLAKKFKVSNLVVLIRLLDGDFISKTDFRKIYTEHIKFQENTKDKNTSGGGNFYRNLSVKTGKRFATALVENTFEGGTLFQDAYRLLGIKKNSTLVNFAHNLGVVV